MPLLKTLRSLAPQQWGVQRAPYPLVSHGSALPKVQRQQPVLAPRTRCLPLCAQAVDPVVQRDILKHYKTVGVGDSWVSVDHEYLYVWSLLGIKSPWYCDDTGHLNAVELNLIFNQMMYLGIYHSLLLGRIPQLCSFPLDQYMEKGWSDFLITELVSSFNAPIDRRDFSGILRVPRPVLSQSKRHVVFNLDLVVHQSTRDFPDPEQPAKYAESEMHLVIKEANSLVE